MEWGVYGYFVVSFHPATALVVVRANGCCEMGDSCSVEVPAHGNGHAPLASCSFPAPEIGCLSHNAFRLNVVRTGLQHRQLIFLWLL